MESNSEWAEQVSTGTQANLNAQKVFKHEITIPKSEIEQQKIGQLFSKLDQLTTLHQRKYYMKGLFMKKNDLFTKFFEKWINLYKVGAIREVTLKKYYLTLNWLIKLVPKLRVCEINRMSYQSLLNSFAETHERQTTMDFHHQIKGAILDAVDEGLIIGDPTRKAIIKGKKPRDKKIKYLNQYQLQTLLVNLKLDDKISNEWMILLIAKTGIRFSEALGITPDDFNFSQQLLMINKTWDYKTNDGFMPTKNTSSIRKLQIDWQTMNQFHGLVKDLPLKLPLFVNGKVYNATINDTLERYCKRLKIPIITIHGLRHTHASLLLYAGVSIASLAKRLGHSNITTTQKTYLHIINELDNKDVDQVMRLMSGLR